jgi:hypothetical protein
MTTEPKANPQSRLIYNVGLALSVFSLLCLIIAMRRATRKAKLLWLFAGIIYMIAGYGMLVMGSRRLARSKPTDLQP